MRKNFANVLTEEEKLLTTNFKSLREKYAGSVSAYAEKDTGYKMVDDDILENDNLDYYNITSEQAPDHNFNVSMCKNFGFNIIALGKQS